MWQLAILQLAKTTGFKKAGPKQQAKHKTKGSIKLLEFFGDFLGIFLGF